MKKKEAVDDLFSGVSIPEDELKKMKVRWIDNIYVGEKDLSLPQDLSQSKLNDLKIKWFNYIYGG